MTLSDSWGLPFKKPVPDIYAMSLYRITINKKGRYSYSKRPALFYRLRCHLVGITKKRPVFIHEMQAEPWLPNALTESSADGQLKRMNPAIMMKIIEYSKKTGMRPIDLWGLEWWYYLKTQHNNPSLWNTIKLLLQNQ